MKKQRAVRASVEWVGGLFPLPENPLDPVDPQRSHALMWLGEDREAVGVLLGGTVGIGTVVFAFGVGPLTQFFLRYLVVRLESPHRQAAASDRG